MPERYAVVVTTINAPTAAMRSLAAGAPHLDAVVIVVGDETTPVDFSLEGTTFLNLEDQRSTGFRYAKIAPTRHYARKNVGYLCAMRAGATVIIETDDDNAPEDGFWARRHPRVPARGVEGMGWVNTYSYFTDALIWPRGLPLNVISAPVPSLSEIREFDCPIQQGLADGDPDVDAIYRLVLPLPQSFDDAPAVALCGAWSPFNSQNTTFWAKAFPLLYLPYHCSFRMTDIWRSFVAQRICYLNGWSILFHKATVFQDRNEHDLMRDFEQEIDGYRFNAAMREALIGLDLPSDTPNIPDAMRRCYACLVDRNWIGAAELDLLEAWLNDCAAAMASADT